MIIFEDIILPAVNILKHTDLFQLESCVWIAEKKTNIPAYDFSFQPIFSINRPRIELPVNTVARIGAIVDYPTTYELFAGLGHMLINNQDEHNLASELQHWYPLLKDLTPKSKVYSIFPDAQEILADFVFPIFIKGNRQTARHNPEMSIARTEADLLRILDAYKKNEILHWQNIVCREFISLKPLEYSVSNKVPLAFEFRTFWWKGNMVGSGHYWSQYIDYTWTEEQKQDALSIAKTAAQKLKIPFLVIDLALTLEDQWIIIECNDAQESGYCGVNKIQLWKNIVEIERN